MVDCPVISDGATIIEETFNGDVRIAQSIVIQIKRNLPWRRTLYIVFHELGHCLIHWFGGKAKHHYKYDLFCCRDEWQRRWVNRFYAAELRKE